MGGLWRAHCLQQVVFFKLSVVSDVHCLDSHAATHLSWRRLVNEAMVAGIWQSIHDNDVLF